MALFFNQSVNDAAQNLDVDITSGLTNEEAQKRSEKYGLIVWREEKKNLSFR